VAAAQDTSRWRLQVLFMDGSLKEYEFAGKPERLDGAEVVTYRYTGGGDNLDHEVQLVQQHVAAIEVKQLAQ
jgi:hypothetical protein